MDQLWQTFAQGMTSWHSGKVFIEHALAISHDTLHVIAGVMVWLVLALLLRRPITSWYPWLGVFAFAVWNEMVDLWIETWPAAARSMQYGEIAKDLLLTTLVPTLLMFAARARPDMFRPSAGRRRGKRG